MKILFDDKFYNSDYADNGASVPGRMESIMKVIGKERDFEIVRPRPADEGEVLLAHTSHHVDSVKPNSRLYERSIDFSKMVVQPGDDPPKLFSFIWEYLFLPALLQGSCLYV